MQHKIQWQLMRVKLERNEEIYELLKCHCKIQITVKQIKYENENIIQQEVWTENIPFSTILFALFYFQLSSKITQNWIKI